MKKLLITLLLFPSFAFAQSAPPFDITKGLTKHNFDQAFENKIDITNGSATGLERTGGSDTGTDISAANLSADMTGAQAASAIKSLQSSHNSGSHLLTPQLLIGNSFSQMESSYPISNYTVTGRLVTFAIEVDLIYKGSATGSVTISGLPYPCVGGTAFPVNITASGVNTYGGTISASIQSDRIIISKNSRSSGASDLVYDSDVENAAKFIVSGTYIMESE